MGNFKSAKEHALNLAMTTMNLLVSGNCETHAILRSCYAVASLIGDNENKEWVDNELSGYGKDNEEIPSYRSFRKLEREGEIENWDVPNAIHRIEHSMKSKESLKVWKGDFEKYAKIPPDWCYNILSSVQDRCLKFSIDTINQLEYSGTIHSLIETTQNEVNKKLIEINPKINSELQSISNNVKSQEPTDRSKAIHSCRRILKLIADDAFPARKGLYKDSLGEEHPVKENDYMNRLLFFLEEKKVSKLVEKEIQYLAPFFDTIRELSCKGEHFEISKFETEQVVVHTYLILSQILKLLNKSSLLK